MRDLGRRRELSYPVVAMGSSPRVSYAAISCCVGAANLLISGGPTGRWGVGSIAEAEGEYHHTTGGVSEPNHRRLQHLVAHQDTLAAFEGDPDPQAVARGNRRVGSNPQQGSSGGYVARGPRKVPSGLGNKELAGSRDPLPLMGSAVQVNHGGPRRAGVAGRRELKRVIGNPRRRLLTRYSE